MHLLTDQKKIELLQIITLRYEFRLWYTQLVSLFIAELSIAVQCDAMRIVSRIKHFRFEFNLILRTLVCMLFSPMMIIIKMMKWNWMSSLVLRNNSYASIRLFFFSFIQVLLRSTGYLFFFCSRYNKIIFSYLHKMFINQLSNLKKNHHNSHFEK